MLEYLHLKNVGPAPEMALKLAPRLNLLTGDNGLGKSFLLDIAWWALTRRWPHDLNHNLTSGYPARPTDIKTPATIDFRVQSKVKSITYTSTYVPRDEAWIGKAGRPWNPGLVIYAHADGGFSVWDPARNYWKKKGNVDVQERLPGYVFSPQDVWNGLTVESESRSVRVCKGLLDDWSVWIREGGSDAKFIADILRGLAPKGEEMDIGPLIRLSIDDSRDIPSIKTPYSSAVPLVHASSGVRRVAGLAYMLMWSWNQHVRAAAVLGEDTAKQVVILFDEIEAHLHPRWQRSILGSVLNIAKFLHPYATVQLLAATHSPLVLASAEPIFDSTKDAWFDLSLDRSKSLVAVDRRDFVRHGDVSNWLTSNAFDLKSARSLEAEKAIENARALLRDPEPDAARAKAINQELHLAGMPDIDPFWVRWGKFMETVGAAK